MDHRLPHTERTLDLLRAGERAEAKRRHNKRVKDELARAEAGEVINLSDLMAARDEIVVDEFTDGAA